MPTKINKNVYGQISIHTLCEEGDDEGQCSAIFFDISIHTLCEEGDNPIHNYDRDELISIHTLCEEGDDKRACMINAKKLISIHTLCEEGDCRHQSTIQHHLPFQSTPSVKRATLIEDIY